MEGRLQGGRPLATALAACACLVAAAIGLGWVPFLRYAWGFTLWRYLPPAADAVLAGLLLLLCLPAVRRALLRASERVWGAVGSSPAAAVAGLVALPFALWLLRERQFFGDSNLFMMAALMGWKFALPDVGATWLLGVAVRGGETVGVGGRESFQALVCLCGSLALWCFAMLSRHLAPAGGARAAVVAFLFCGGVLRVFAGHVEVYAFVLICGGLFLWSGLALVGGRGHWTLPCLALGLGLWLHPQFLFLSPALLLLLYLAEPSLARTRLLKRQVLGLALTAAPLAAFLALMWLSGQHDDLARAWERGLHIIGARQNPDYEGGSFLRPWWQTSVAGTDYVIGSPAHLKYLANAFFVLAPGVVPILGGLAIASRRRFVATPQAAFLSGAGACLIFYTCVTRPLWGPHDWDMFSLTAVTLGCLAMLLWFEDAGEPLRAHLLALVIGASLLLVTVPFLWIGVAPERAAGPFVHSPVEGAGDASAWKRFQERIDPWL